MRWGTITAVSPLRVRLDGDTDPLPFTPNSLVDPLILEVNDRVRCEISGRVIIVGKAGGLPLPIASDTGAGIVELATPAEAIAGTADDLAVTPDGLMATRKAPVIGQIPSTVDIGPGSTSAFVQEDGTVTFTACTSVSLNGVFTGLGADLYEITLDFFTSVGVAMATRLRAGGVDLSTGSYSYTATSLYLGSGPNRSASDTATRFMYWTPGSGSTPWTGGGKAWLHNPALPRTTTGGMSSSYAGDGDRRGWDEHSMLTTTAIYDGFTIAPDSGTITGSIKVVQVA